MRAKWCQLCRSAWSSITYCAVTGAAKLSENGAARSNSSSGNVRTAAAAWRLFWRRNSSASALLSPSYSYQNSPLSPKMRQQSLENLIGNPFSWPNAGLRLALGGTDPSALSATSGKRQPLSRSILRSRPCCLQGQRVNERRFRFVEELSGATLAKRGGSSAQPSIEATKECLGSTQSPQARYRRHRHVLRTA